MKQTRFAKQGRASRVVMIGDVPLGGLYPVRLQSMTNTPTTNIRATASQAMRLFDAGADFVRLAIPNKESAAALPGIRNLLSRAAYHQPIIADIHFKPDLAISVAPYVEKIRINPANFIEDSGLKKHLGSDTEHNEALSHLNIVSTGKLQKLAQLLSVCKENGTAIRIGGNMGSLPHGQSGQPGHSAETLVNTIMAYLHFFEDQGFYNTVISLKASNPMLMTDACMLMASQLRDKDMHYPFHIGVTETGNGLAGRIKSALGVSMLLNKGIGSTLRISLTEDPLHEIRVAKKILDFQQHFSSKIDKLETPSGSRVYDFSSDEDLAIAASIELGEMLMTGKISGLRIQAPKLANQDAIAKIESLLLQACGKLHSLTEFIACPGCARSSQHIETVLEAVQDSVGRIPGLKIAVMGCVVNGPGEMAGADYGLMGASKNSYWLFKGTRVVQKNIAPEQAPQALFQLLQKDGWIGLE